MTTETELPCKLNLDNPIQIRDTIMYRDGLRGDVYAPGTIDHGAHIPLNREGTATRDGRPVVYIQWRV